MFIQALFNVMDYFFHNRFVKGVKKKYAVNIWWNDCAGSILNRYKKINCRQLLFYRKQVFSAASQKVLEKSTPDILVKPW